MAGFTNFARQMGGEQMTRIVIQSRGSGKYIGQFTGRSNGLKRRWVKNIDDAKHYYDKSSANSAIEAMCLERSYFRLVEVPKWYWES